MLIKYLQYRYVKARMTAYLDGDLPAPTRRFIARQIDANPLCYREYIAAKQTRQELERSLPSFGQVSSQKLDALWANIQSEMAQPDPAPQRLPLQPQYRLSYSVALLMLMVILFAPFAIDAGRSQLVPVAQHPLPDDTARLTSPAATPQATAQSIAFAVETVDDMQATVSAGIAIQNTPAPQTPRS